MPHQLRALREARRPQRVALGDEPARGVDDDLAAIRDAALADQLVRPARRRQPQEVDGDHLVGAEAVVQLAHAAVARLDAGLGVGRPGGVLRHLAAHEVDGAAGEERGRVGGQALARDEDSLLLEVRPRVQEGLGDQHRGGAAVGRRAALQLGQGLVDHGGLLDLLEAVDVLELRVGVLHAVRMIDASDLGEVFCFGAVSGVAGQLVFGSPVWVCSQRLLLYVFTARVAKHLGSAWGIGKAPSLGHHQAGGSGGIFPVVEESLQAAGHHFLKADHQHTIRGAAGDILSPNGEAGRAGGTVVVDVDDGDLRHAKLIEHPLATGGVAVAVACNALVHIVVINVGVQHGLDAGFEAQLCVVHLAAGFDELGHAHAKDVAWCFLLGCHLDIC